MNNDCIYKIFQYDMCLSLQILFITYVSEIDILK